MIPIKAQLIFGMALLLLAGQSTAQDGTDDCAAPTPVGEGTIVFDTSTMLTHGDMEQGVCGTYHFFKDMFWVYTATLPGTLTIDTAGSNFDTQLAVYSGIDCNAICLGQNDDGGPNNSSVLTIPGVSVGDTFVIQVGGWANNNGPGNLSIHLPLPPANDNCETPTALTGVGTFAYDPVNERNALTSGFTGDSGCTLDCSLQDVFFTWTAPTDGDFTIETPSDTLAYDTRLAVYAGTDCLTAACIAADDDSGEDLGSLVELLGVTAGDEFLIQVGSGLETTPLVASSLDITRVPDGSDCSLGFPVTGTGIYPYDTTGYPTTGFAGAMGACPPMESDFFFLWTCDMNGDYQFDTNMTFYDTKMSIYAGVDCTALCLAADDDSGQGTRSLILMQDLLAGESYLVQVGGFAAGGGASNLAVTLIVDPCEVPDDAFEDNDDCTTPTLLTPGMYTGLHIDAADADFYAIDVPPGMALTLTEVLDTGDTRYNLHDAGCASILEMNAADTLTFGNATLSPIPVVLEVFHGPGSMEACGDYDFDLVFTADPCLQPDDSFEDNDDCTTPTLLGAGMYTGLRIVNGDSDFFEIDIPAGFAMTWSETLDSQDASYNLYDAGCVTVLESNAADTLAFGNASPAPVTVVVEVFHGLGATEACGDYEFEVTLVADPCLQADDPFEDNDDCLTATALSDGTETALFITPGDLDVFSFCVPNGGTVTVDVLFAHLQGDMELYLREADSLDCGTGGAGLDLLTSSTTQTDDENITWTNLTGFDANVILEAELLNPLGDTYCNMYDLVLTGSGNCLGEFGTEYCIATANSTGGPAHIFALGSPIAGDNNFTLHANNLPDGEFIFYLGSYGQDQNNNPAGSQGNLCLGGTEIIARFVDNGSPSTNTLGQVMGGAYSAAIDLTQIPLNTNPNVILMSGETFNFQGWHRDLGQNNFTPGLSVTFQ